MTQFVFTIGTGKNGTHVIHHIMHQAAKAFGASFHEPLPYLDAIECMTYERRLDVDQVAGHFVFQEWERRVRDAAVGRRFVHVANNHLTCLVPVLRKQFPGCKFINPVRQDVDACIVALRTSGAYDKHRIFPQPHQPNDYASWYYWHPIVKCAWLRQMRINRACWTTRDAPVLSPWTELLGSAAFLRALADFVPEAELNVEMAVAVANTRHTRQYTDAELAGYRREVQTWREHIDRIGPGRAWNPT